MRTVDLKCTQEEFNTPFVVAIMVELEAAEHRKEFHWRLEGAVKRSLKNFNGVSVAPKVVVGMCEDEGCFGRVLTSVNPRRQNGDRFPGSMAFDKKSREVVGRNARILGICLDRPAKHSLGLT